MWQHNLLNVPTITITLQGRESLFQKKARVKDFLLAPLRNVTAHRRICGSEVFRVDRVSILADGEEFFVVIYGFGCVAFPLDL